VVDYLLEHRASVDAIGATGRMALHACRSGHNAVVELLLSRGADPNSRDEAVCTPVKYVDRGWRTALHWASFNGHTAIAERLIACSAQASTADQDGWTALHWSCRYGHTTITQVICDALSARPAPDSNEGN
jgi:ankyrin repeat protein